MKSTFIKLDRSIMAWRWYHDANTFRLFVHLLLTAQVKEYYIGEIKVGRGEVAVSYMNVANTLGLTKQQIRTAFRHLKVTGEITFRRYSKFSVVSVVNYELYQANQHSKQHSLQQSSNTQSTDEQHHNKNIKNIKKEIYIGLGVKDEILLDAIAEFELMRDSKKKPLTDNGRKRFVDRLNKLSENTAEQVKLVQKATDNCWLTVYSNQPEKDDMPSSRMDDYIEFTNKMIFSEESDSK